MLNFIICGISHSSKVIAINYFIILWFLITFMFQNKTTPHATPLTVLLSKHLIFTDQISSVFRSCCYHSVSALSQVPQQPVPLNLMLFSPSLVTVIHLSALSLSLKIAHLQQGQNFLVCTDVAAPKSCYTTPILYSHQWLKITECVKYSLLSLICKVLTQPPST